VRRLAVVARSVTFLGALGLAAWRLGPAVFGRRLVARTERRLNPVRRPGPYRASERAEQLHRTLFVADLHADSLLWGRDLLVRGDRGHVDVPRLVEGGVALQAFAACPKVPRHLNLDRNDGRSDDVTLLGLASGWPIRALTSQLLRTLYLAERLDRLAAGSRSPLSVIRSAGDLTAYVERRRADRSITAGLLTIEGAHALGGDLDNLDRVVAAGYRMIGLVHFFDNEVGGSAHGVDRGGLTPFGRELVGRMEARSVLVDVAHASARTLDDVLTIARRPVVASHTGVRGVADNGRNLSDDQLRGIAATGGLVGIGFWPTACGGDDAGWIARSIAHAVAVAGIDHVGLGSDFDGAVPVPFDASGMALLTDALLAQGLSDDDIAAVMGGNALRLLAASLPPR
jgi:microsomal dipeptidase-like Zn-dependent dipeptidase